MSPEPKGTGSLSFWLTVSLLRFAKVLLRCWIADNSVVTSKWHQNWEAMVSVLSFGVWCGWVVLLVFLCICVLFFSLFILEWGKHYIYLADTNFHVNLSFSTLNSLSWSYGQLIFVLRKSEVIHQTITRFVQYQVSQDAKSSLILETNPCVKCCFFKATWAHQC